MEPSSESLFTSHLLDRARHNKVGRINHPHYNLVEMPGPIQTSPESTTQQQRLDNISTATSTCQLLATSTPHPVNQSHCQSIDTFMQHVTAPTGHSHPHHDCWALRKPDSCSRSSRLFRCRFVDRPPNARVSHLLSPHCQRSS